MGHNHICKSALPKSAVVPHAWAIQEIAIDNSIMSVLTFLFWQALLKVFNINLVELVISWQTQLHFWCICLCDIDMYTFMRFFLLQIRITVTLRLLLPYVYIVRPTFTDNNYVIICVLWTFPVKTFLASHESHSQTFKLIHLICFLFRAITSLWFIKNIL